MAYCETHEFFDEVSMLIKLISDSVSLSVGQKVRLKELLDNWDSIECPDARCRPEACPYARPIDWVEHHRYPTLFDLIEALDQSRPINTIPKAAGLDALDATWARRPGHYNP